MSTMAPEALNEAVGSPQSPLDLRSVYRALGFAGANLARTPGRYRLRAELVEDSPVAVMGRPMTVAACIDGIQTVRVVTRREHRDVLVAYVSAGAVAGRRMTRLEERLAVVCSHLDEPEVRAASSRITIAALDDNQPEDLSMAADQWIDKNRRSLEATIVETAPTTGPDEFLLLDGSLPPDCGRSDVVGVVKSALDTDWLTDPQLLPAEGGWRSPAMRLPARRRGEQDRLTAFVRLRTCGPQHPWGFSLIRVEVFARAGVGLLDGLAARVVADRQPLGSGDPRAEIQIASMFSTEKVLKSRIPAALQFS
jgi:hypothetical protein